MSSSVALRNLRFYSTPQVKKFSTPQIKKSGFAVVNALKYVKEVDDHQEKIINSSTDEERATTLVERISDKPELLSLLLLFHHELAGLGITPSSPREFSTMQIWRYRSAYAWKLARIHNVFWDQCRLLDVAERSHRLGLLPSAIGVLDPAHFQSSYGELQSGVFRGTDFRQVEIIGPSRFKV